MEKVVRVVRGGEAPSLSVLGAEVSFLCEADHTGRAWSLMQVVAPQDAGPPPHDHDWDEAYFITAGEFEFEVDGSPLRVQAGDFVYVPAGVLHGFRGLSAEGSRMLIFDAPAHAGSFFKDVDREVRGVQDLPKVPAIGLRNGIRFAPPPAKSAA
jgi:quercetin dioxygenase-like cupin family protein